MTRNPTRKVTTRNRYSKATVFRHRHHYRSLLHINGIASDPEYVIVTDPQTNTTALVLFFTNTSSSNVLSYLVYDERGGYQYARGSSITNIYGDLEGTYFPLINSLVLTYTSNTNVGNSTYYYAAATIATYDSNTTLLSFTPYAWINDSHSIGPAYWLPGIEASVIATPAEVILVQTGALGAQFIPWAWSSTNGMNWIFVGNPPFAVQLNTSVTGVHFPYQGFDVAIYFYIEPTGNTVAYASMFTPCQVTTTFSYVPLQNISVGGSYVPNPKNPAVVHSFDQQAIYIYFIDQSTDEVQVIYANITSS